MTSPVPVIRDGVISGMEMKQEEGRNILVIRLNGSTGEIKDFVLRSPDRIVLDVAKGAAPLAPIVQQDKRFVIVLDPGHGGRDGGLVTTHGQEKSISLELAVQIRKLLQREKNLSVVMTRDRDVSLTLDERAASANTAGAQVFVSIHVASGAAGRIYIEDPADDFGSQAQRSPSRDFLGFEAGSEHQEITWGRQQAAHAQQSGELGRVLVRELSGNPAAEPAQAPVAGLKAIDAAAVIVEIGSDLDRSRLTEAVARGIVQYAGQNR